MRITRTSIASGFVALLLGTGVASTALAAPTQQYIPGWTVVEQPSWDNTQPWYSRTVVVQPTGVVSGPVGTVPVTVLASPATVQTFAEPRFVSTFQQTVVPTLVGIVPVETLQNGIEVVQVQPNVQALVGPQFYCPLNAAASCQALAAQLAARTPGFTTVNFNGPLGPGVYVAYQI
jgi:hypothetical protein